MKRQNRGFTLAELLVVIAIVGLLSSIVLVSLKETTKKARTTAVLQFAASVHHALGAYAVGMWDFDDQTNPGRDTSGNNNNGTLYNFTSDYLKCTPADTPSGKGCALKFDGTSNYINIPAAAVPSGNTITVTAWLYGGSNLPKENQLIWADAGAGTERTISIHWVWTGGNITFQAGGGSPGNYDWIERNIAESEYKGIWSHWVFTKNAAIGKMEIYRNGVLWHSGTGKNIGLTVTTRAWIGSQSSSSYFHGLMDDVRIYEEALTYSQIQKLYAEGAARHGLLAGE